MDSHPFMSSHPLIPMIELLKYLTFKIQGQSHSLRSHDRYNILSTHIPFIPCWSALPFLRCSYLSQCESNILSTHIPFIPFNLASHRWVMTFSKLDLENQGSRSRGEVTIQNHNVGITSYRLTSLSFHVNRPSHSWDPAFSKFDLENQGSR